MSVIVLLEVQVKPEAVETLKTTLKAILPDTRAYDGCHEVDIYGNLDEGENMVFYEVWDSREHHQRYLAWRVETGAMDKLASMLSAPPSIRYYERLDV